MARSGDLELSAAYAASYLHVGPYERLSEAYQVLFGWVNANATGRGLKVNGPVREVYLVGPGSGRPDEEYVTELQVPVDTGALLRRE